MCDVDLEKIADSVTLQYFPENHEIFQQGSLPDTLYIIKKGSVKVVQKVGKEEREVVTLGEGDFFGEMSLISNDPHNATIRTSTECELFTLSREAFQKLLSENAEMASHISEKFMKRLRENIRTEKKRIHD